MRRRSYKLFIEDILSAINKVEDYIKDLTYEEFLNDNMRIDAVVRNLEIIGEAAKYVPADIKEQYADIPWKRMMGLRNIVVHEYFGIDFSIIWNIASINMPELKPEIELLLKNKDIY